MILLQRLSLIHILLASLYTIFVGNAVSVGGCRYFMENREHQTSASKVFYGFQNGRYGNVVKTMFFRDLFILLWTLLLIVPGIIKSYSYRLVPYILSENPHTVSYTHLLGVVFIIAVTFFASKGLKNIQKVASIGEIACMFLNVMLIGGALLVLIGNKGELAQPIVSAASLVESPNPEYAGSLAMQMCIRDRIYSISWDIQTSVSQ